MDSPFLARSFNAERGASLQRFRVDFELKREHVIAGLDPAGACAPQRPPWT
jgi:hypothetical protein